MNMLRFFKLKELNGELDDCTRKELFLIEQLAYSRLELGVYPPLWGNDKISYHLTFINVHGGTAFCSANNKMFEFINNYIIFDFDLTFYNSELCKAEVVDAFDLFYSHYNTTFHYELVKILTSLDKKFKISKSVFKSFGFGH